MSDAGWAPGLANAEWRYFVVRREGGAGVSGWEWRCFLHRAALEADAALSAAVRAALHDQPFTSDGRRDRYLQLEGADLDARFAGLKLRGGQKWEVKICDKVATGPCASYLQVCPHHEQQPALFLSAPSAHLSAP
jgi:hypothetical protein